MSCPLACDIVQMPYMAAVRTLRHYPRTSTRRSDQGTTFETGPLLDPDRGLSMQVYIYVYTWGLFDLIIIGNNIN